MHCGELFGITKIPHKVGKTNLYLQPFPIEQHCTDAKLLLAEARAKLWAKVRAEVWAEVRAEVSAEVQAVVWAEVGNSKFKWCIVGNYFKLQKFPTR